MQRLMGQCRKIILGYPIAILCVLLIMGGVLAYYAREFRLDASADSLILESDPDLLYSQMVIRRYGTSDFLFIAYTPSGSVFSDETLHVLSELREELTAVERVASVITLLDVPLLRNPPVPIKEMKENIKTLEHPDVDMELAKQELSSSPIYKNLLLSEDLRSTAIQVNLKENADFVSLRDRRSALVTKRVGVALSDAERAELAEIEHGYFAFKKQLDKERHEDICRVREIIDGYRSTGRLFLGGVPMVADDMISFIKNDLKLFGLVMLGFLIVMLGVIFKRIQWVVLPMLCCFLSVITMLGLLGLTGWEVTVVSSNFVSLQLIMTMSLTIHLIVRYTEVTREDANAHTREKMNRTIETIFKPCLYTSLTTIAGFSSLVLCDILPVVNFGWMMTLGLVVSLVLTFLLFPALVLLVGRESTKQVRDFGEALTQMLADVTARFRWGILAVSVVVAVLTVVGISKLEVENSFIDYFRKSTEIYQGMEFIDSDIGGTTPLDVTIDFGVDEEVAESETAVADELGADADVFDDFDEFEDSEDDETYWFTAEKIDTIRRVHDYLEARPETGKVLSLNTMAQVARQLVGDREMDSFDLALLVQQLPERFRSVLLYPYVSMTNNQARVTMRLRDSNDELKRDAFLKDVHGELIGSLGLPEKQVRLSGMMVLYNNMLQSLFQSQIKTIGATVLALMFMFMILFRSVKLSLIAIFPNLLSSLVVLGVMGMAGIPLDMMTTTIVAISVGIAVDNTIHYIHRFRHEIEADYDYGKAMHRCHGSIGHAMYYTSITITIGFSILGISNFIPTVLFGLLTGLAMVIALLAALTLLPTMIIIIKPFGPDRSS